MRQIDEVDHVAVGQAIQPIAKRARGEQQQRKGSAIMVGFDVPKAIPNAGD